MPTLPLQFVLGACSGELLSGSPDTLLRRICTDSREAQTGDLFIALRGERFDAHDFLKDVTTRGASALLVERSKAPEAFGDCAVIAVEDTRRSLGKLAASYRSEFNLPVIAVAGSNGKTTTKELIASVLRQKFSTLASPASFNNDIGVPLTLLQLEQAHGAAVLEVGTNHPGELAPLLAMIQPRYGVLTSIGREHLEFFGDLDGVVREEGSIAEALSREGKLFIHGEAEGAERIIDRCPAPAVRVGLEARNDWSASNVRMDASGMEFQVNAPVPEFCGTYRLSLFGRHQVVNALLAIAVGAELGLSRLEIQRGLLECPPPKMRLQLFEVGGVCVLDDAYNANADSTRAALDTLSEFPCTGRRVAVLGEMSELGTVTEEAHCEVGRYVAETGVQQLFAVGRMAGIMGGAARAAGLSAVEEHADVESASAALQRFVRSGDVVLLKASRSARLERITDQLRGSMKQTDSLRTQP